MEHRCIHLCVPSYSPFLINIVVENAISAFKWSLKNSLDSGARRTRILVLLGLEEVRNQLLNQQHESRLATMTQLAEQAAQVMTPAKAASWFTPSQRYLVHPCLSSKN